MSLARAGWQRPVTMTRRRFESDSTPLWYKVELRKFFYDAFVNHYDEFSYLEENQREWNLRGPLPAVRRVFVSVEGLRQVSALVWGDSPPELVLVHGTAQNAHTFDTVALALGRPLVAVDLPHHGHSDASFFGPRAVKEHARDLTTVIEDLCVAPLAVVAMSYGGLVSLALLHQRPELATQLILVDITPGVDASRASQVQEFVGGPEIFSNFEEIFERTRRFNPQRSESSLRRGILHNALERPDGTWVWRHQSHDVPTLPCDTDFDLWRYLEELPMPVTLIRAMGPTSMVNDADAEEFLQRRPRDEIIQVPGASHSIQGSHPLELARLLAERI